LRKFQDIRDEGGHVADARHKTCDHMPAELRSLNRRRSLDDGSNSARFDNAPDEECDARDRCDDGLDSKKVAAVEGNAYTISVTALDPEIDRNRRCSKENRGRNRRNEVKRRTFDEWGTKLRGGR
jgi:hypothetical protein